MKIIVRCWKTVFLYVTLLSISSCCSAKFVPLPPKIVVGIYHTVKKDETLWRICKTYGVELQEVAELNNIKDASKINVGDKIFIPGAKKVREIEVFKKEPLPSEVDIVQSKGKFSWPVKGEIVSYFGERGGLVSQGIDIHAPPGTPIRAAHSGKVIYANALPGYGNLLIIQHADRYTTLYAHNQENLVKEGTWVKRESVIARVGNSHDPTALPTLHFQIRKDNRARNPLFYLQ